ncbi:MAG: NAD(+) diphosphatase [Pseudomonadota bacterium]
MFIPTLTASTQLDRQSEKRSDADYIAERLAAPDARFMVLADHKPVIWSNDERTEGGIRWFASDELRKFGLPVQDAVFLGVTKSDAPDAGAARFSVACTEHRVRNAPGGLEHLRPIVDLRSLAMNGGAPAEELSLMGLAKGISHWHDNNRCCGLCGGSTEPRDGGWKRKCWACGAEHFPRTDPVVIMAIIDRRENRADDRLLLGHEARFMPNMWSTLAGFLEAGEDIEHAVRRETREEAGITVGAVRYHSSQPWAFPYSLMIGCHGFAETTDLDIDTNEILDARWFSRRDLELMLAGQHPEGLWVPGQQAIARSLVQAFVEGAV